jgi:hypothetical protein
MKKLIILFSFISIFTQVEAQSITGTEIGIDAVFHASNFGGTFGIGGKYGMKFGDYIIAGPSLRYQRSWSKNVVQGSQTGFNVIGGGIFGHARFYNAFFVGAEFEYLRSPFTNTGLLTPTSKWAPTFFVGGGFSMEFNEKWRLNAGIMYDVIDHVNSPLRTQYFMRNANNALLPVIYRITFFFPLG